MWWTWTALAQDPPPPPPDPPPVVVEAPVPLTAEQRVDEARRRIAAGDLPGARLVLDEVAAMAPGEAVLADVAYLSTFVLELEGRHAEALAGWDALLAAAPTDDVRFRRAEALAALGRVDEARAALAALGDPRDRSEPDRAKIALLSAMWQIRAGEVKPGVRALDAALSGVPPGVSEFEARARALLAETAAESAAGLAFTGSDRKKKKLLERRAALVKGTQDQLVLLVRLGHAPSTLRGFFAAIRAYDDLGAAMLAETPPRRLTEEQLRINRELLAGKVQNVWVKAAQLAEMGQQWAVQVGYEAPEAARLAEREADLERRISALPLPSVQP